jgi:hypothetical protein
MRDRAALLGACTLRRSRRCYESTESIKEKGRKSDGVVENTVRAGVRLRQDLEVVRGGMADNGATADRDSEEGY